MSSICWRCFPTYLLLCSISLVHEVREYSRMAVLRSLGRWKKDDEVTKCDGCKNSFSFLVRKHHCRSCGGIFCHQCSSRSLVITIISPTVHQRVCDSCHVRLASPPAAVVPRQQPEAPCIDPVSAVADPPKDSIEPVSNVNEVMPENVSQSSMDSDDFDGPMDITSKIASALVSSHCIPSTGNLSFLSALQDGLKKVDAENILSILIFVSTKQQQAMMVTFEQHETMGDLAARLAEFYFKLENPPFRKMTTEAHDALREKLRFSSEYQMIDPTTHALSVAHQCRNVVLSMPEVLAQQSTITASERSLKDFWRSERSDQHEDPMVAGW